MNLIEGEADHAPNPLHQAQTQLSDSDELQRFGAKRQGKMSG